MKLGIAIIGALVLLTACGSKEEKKEVQPIEIIENINVSGNGANVIIAYYNQDSLKTHYNYYREQDSIMVIKGTAFQNELGRRNKDLENYITVNDAKAQQGLLSQNDIAMIQQKIQQKQNVIMQYQQSTGGRLEEETYGILNIIGNRIDTFGKEYCDEKGIQVLFSYTKGGQITYINGSLDVTAEFIEYLNKRQVELESEIQSGKE